MKFAILVGLISFGSFKAQAYPPPQVVPVGNLYQLNEYIYKNYQEIYDSSGRLAQAQIPNSYYYLVIREIKMAAFGSTIDHGVQPIATLRMANRAMECFRDIYGKVTSDQFGENRKWKFSVAPTILCNRVID